MLRGTLLLCTLIISNLRQLLYYSNSFYEAIFKASSQLSMLPGPWSPLVRLVLVIISIIFIICFKSRFWQARHTGGPVGHTAGKYNLLTIICELSVCLVSVCMVSFPNSECCDWLSCFNGVILLRLSLVRKRVLSDHPQVCLCTSVHRME